MLFASISPLCAETQSQKQASSSKLIKTLLNVTHFERNSSIKWPRMTHITQTQPANCSSICFQATRCVSIHRNVKKFDIGGCGGREKMCSARRHPTEQTNETHKAQYKSETKVQHAHKQADQSWLCTATACKTTKSKTTTQEPIKREQKRSNNEKKLTQYQPANILCRFIDGTNNSAHRTLDSGKRASIGIRCTGCPINDGMIGA